MRDREPTGLSGVHGTHASSRDGVYPEERRAVELAQVIPDLAGFFFDTSGNVVVLLKDVGKPPAMKSLLQPRFGRELARGRVRNPAADLIVRTAKYSFLELKEWRDRLMDADILSIPGVVWLDLDEARNHVVIGLDVGADRAAAGAIARDLGLPTEAVEFEVTGPYVPQQTLRDEFRPIQGGVQIQRVSGTSPATCTLGFTAVSQGQDVFLTAGHCSPNPTGADGVEQFQPTAPLTASDSASMTAIGREIVHYSEPCGSRRCSYSDAAIYGLVADTVPPLPSQPWILGRIARPASGCFPGPCNPPVLNLAPTPYWVIDTTHESFVVNDLVSKIGSATGWSQGYVQSTCVNVSPAQGVTYYCQMYANYGQDAGDSGAPILLDINGGADSTVTLGGIHSGKAGKNAVFSPWSGILQDYGSLSVVSPAQQDPSVPALPPDSVPAAVWAELYAPENISSPTSDWGVPFPRNLVLVMFREDASQAERQAAVDGIGGDVVGGEPIGTGGYYYVRITDDGTSAPLFQAIAQLQSLPQVELASPDLPAISPAYLMPRDGNDWRIWHVNPDSGRGAKWGHEAVAAPLAWGCATGDSTLRVGIVDHGFFSVSDLVDNIDPGSHANFGTTGTYAHGTQVASIVAARGGNGTGMTGMMWRAQLALEDYNLAGHNPTLIALHRLRDLALRGVRVINLSSGLYWSATYGRLPNPTHADSQVVQVLYAAFRRELALQNRLGLDPLIVLSAGNETIDAFWNALPRLVNDFPTQIVSVASSDSGGALSGFSNTGLLVTLAAPGGAVTGLNAVGTPVPINGTSYSAAYVTAIAGLSLSLDPRLTTVDLRDAITRGAAQGGRRAGTIPIANAYETLKTVATHSGAPLCGNRVWVSGNAVIAERDTATHATQQLVALGEPAAWVNVRHGGRRIEVSAESRDRAFELRQGTWVETSDTATTPAGGAFLSLWQYSHGMDSAVGVTPRAIVGGVTLKVGIWDSISKTTDTIGEIGVPLLSADSYTCMRFLPEDAFVNSDGTFVVWREAHCADSMVIGTFERYDSRAAFPPSGGDVVVSVTKIRQDPTNISDYSACPWSEGETYQGEPWEKCRTVHFRSVVTGTTVHAMRIAGGARRTLYTTSGQVFWIGVAENATETITGEGAFSQESVLEPRTNFPPNGFHLVAQPQVITDCSVIYRGIAAAGSPRWSVPSVDACTGQQGQGTIAPAPPVASQR